MIVRQFFLNINIKYDENYFYDIFTSKIIIYTDVGREIQLPGKYNRDPQKLTQFDKFHFIYHPLGVINKMEYYKN